MTRFTLPAMLLAGLAAGAAFAAPAQSDVEHRTRITHSSGPVEAAYRGRVDITHRQLGAATPGGRPSTLRCLWSANVIVDRAATSASGLTLARSVDGGSAIAGHRAGWCDTHRESIAQEVARRTDQLRTHVEVLAAEDHDVLRAELDRAATRTG